MVCLLVRFIIGLVLLIGSCCGVVLIGGYVWSIFFR